MTTKSLSIECEKQIESAKEFAADKFAKIGKKNHFLEVFNIMRDEFDIQDTEVLVAGLLHDTLEDTSTTYEEIKSIFSREIADLVQEVSHPKNYNQEEKEEYYKKIKTISTGAKIIKMADFTSHLRNFIKICKRGEQNLYPKFANNSKYIKSIRDFLDSCDESIGKKIVYDLANQLEVLL
ncbi:MAG: HD domain-containing protein [Candidatus Pacebacteria bacterium]|nr:HD domain-containing protein [Candidatus Paceibacterota bacterium]